MKFLKVVLIIILLLAAVGLILPANTHVERSVVINAPQQLVFSYLNDFQKFNEWSPWAKKDPNTKYRFSGPSVGVGSKMSWESEHDHVGVGSQEIVKSEPFSYVETSLDFEGQGTAGANYRLSSEGGGTQVVWSFDTDHGWNILGRYMGLMIGSMLGPEYEAGLNNLKQVVEAAATGE